MDINRRNFLIFTSKIIAGIGFIYSCSEFFKYLIPYNLNVNTFLLYLSLGIFIFAWILQFIGHKIEGKKPSFFKDIQFNR